MMLTSEVQDTGTIIADSTSNVNWCIHLSKCHIMAGHKSQLMVIGDITDDTMLHNTVKISVTMSTSL